ncbi:ERG4/ERG24 ergosterol biosynthesis protein [Ascodesmis nigricans]|uniref:7-dehydrocholesterol reductase n=1 Tax=Ascodesmis nigricans TaxID=341454 RepID=A0A4V3SHM7_9PEZI|nr:ERG4/ERG24 ergosterol biosynthesis protein [Ascodesmis nigricans]
MLGCGAIIAFCPLLVIVVQVAMINFEGSILDALWAVVQMGPVEWATRYAPRPTSMGFQIYGAWVAFQVLLYAFLPAPWSYGQRTPAGHLLGYRTNGLFAWFVSHAAYFAGSYYGWIDPAIIAKNWLPLIIAFNAYGYFLPLMAYVKAHWAPTHAEDRKFSGSIVYDYYWGVEFNPRIGEWFDFKLFHNGRPGIVAWTLIDLSFTAWQYQQNGFVTNSIIIVDILHAIYVVDFFVNEDWYLRTIDICHDHYGFYLAWGSMVWLPTMYTLQAQWLARFPNSLSPLAATIILSVGLMGYVIFRSVNHQKDLARRTRGDCTIWGRPAEVLTARYTTSDGKQHQTILLCSGWWGVVRHANYLGDLFFSWAACFAAGWTGGRWCVVPFTYGIFMTWLLVHRCVRDEIRCGEKYGSTWEEYCKRVRWRLVPGVF